MQDMAAYRKKMNIAAGFLLWGTAGTTIATKTTSEILSAGDFSASSLPGSVLHRFHHVLKTNSRRYFGHDEKAFQSAIDWHHSRLREVVDGEPPAASAATAARRRDERSSDVHSSGGAVESAGAGAGAGAGGIFVVFTSHRQATRARETLQAALSPSSVMTAAHNRDQGGCFFVHASAADVDALLLVPEGIDHATTSEGEPEGIRGSGGSSGPRLFDGFVAVPPSLKLAPSLLDHGENITPGKALRRNDGVEGLVVRLLPSAASVDIEQAPVVERWRRDWSAASLDLHDLTFWSAPDGHRHREPGGDDAGEEEEDSNTYTRAADFLAREWGGAARTVHALAERLGGVSPAEACGWNDIRVEVEGRGIDRSERSSTPGWVTLRNIGHLLAGQGAARKSRVPPSGRSSDRDEGEKTACLMGLISFLASRPETARVSALPRAKLSNAIAGRIVQGASDTSTPIWDRGVDGTGEVVQVADSGVAQGSCFFRNSATTLGPDHGYLRDADGSLGSGDYQYDLSQRKVVQYIESTLGEADYMDDDDDGHGSHVAGSVAGSIYSGWTGPNDCPDGVAGASADQTAVSCVGKCMAPSVLAENAVDNTFDLDALCPEYDCDRYWTDVCLTDDRSETLEEAKGVAPGAKLAILDLGSSEKLDQAMGGTLWETAGGTGARLHSASWGFPEEPCTVDDASVSFDEWSFENPEHLLIFAAGNLGDDMTGCSIAAPAVAKNILAVGSSMSGEMRLSTGDMDEVSDFSSRGPTSDGRIKPDIVAPGHFTFSASNGGDGSCQLSISSGTSMSCPIAAGAAALVRQYFVDGFYAADLEARGGLCASPWACDTFSPSGALVKAMLIHGANPMGGSSSPDGERGFGRIHLESAMPFEGDGVWALYIEDADGSTSSAGQVVALDVEERSFTVSDEDAAAAVEGGSDTGPGGIRATLVWMDPPATSSSSVQLVHDLDLFVEGPDGTTWTMSGECSGGEASCSLDSRNNVERVVVPASDVSAGTWTVRVSAAHGLVEGGPQSYALAVSIPISTGTGGVNDASSTPTAHPVATPTTPGPTADSPSPSPEVVASPSPTTGADTETPATSPTPSPTSADGVPSPNPSASSATVAPSDGDGALVSGSPSTSSAATATTEPSTIPPTPPVTEGATPSPTEAINGTRAPSVVIAAPEPDDDEGDSTTPAPVVIIASPGGGGEESASSAVVYANTPSPSGSSSSPSSARVVGGTSSPAATAEEAGSSGASRSMGGGGGGSGGWGVLWNAAVVGAVSAVVAYSTAAAAAGPESGVFL